MPAVIPILYVAGTALAAYGAVEQKRSSDAAARVDTATANYNARADMAMAQQLDLDTQENVRTERQDNAVYLSRQAASYASAGVLATTGSPLHAQITNAGRMEQQIQQQWVNSQQKQQELASRAKVGILEGAAQASADRASGSIALINGGAHLAGAAFQGYESGIFS
jgi:hypothetical protein